MRSNDLTGRKGDAKRALRVKVISGSHPGGEKNMVFATLGRVKVHRSGVGASVLTFGALPIGSNALIVGRHARTGWRGLDGFALALSIRAFYGRCRCLLGKESVRSGAELPCGQLRAVVRRVTVAPAVVLIVTVAPAVLPDRSGSQG